MAVPAGSVDRLAPAQCGRRSCHPGRHRARPRQAQFPICDRGRYACLATAARLRRRCQGLHRVSTRHSSGRDAAALCPRPRGWRRARQLSCTPELLCRGPAVCRRRTSPRWRPSAEGSHRAHRREAAMVSGDPRKTQRELADELRLHPPRPPVTRLSRKVLVGIAMVAMIAVLGAVMWALDGRRGKQETGSELYNTEHKTTADELAKLPRDYSGLPPGVPALGPPLPGDFGRANVQQLGPQGVDPEQQRVAQETETARTSRLFAPSTTVNRALSTAPTPSGGFDVLGEKPPIDADSLQNMQDRKLAFLNGPLDKRAVSNQRLEAPASKYIVQAGSVIAAALLTGIRSDLPGQVTGQVTENVYDSPTGRYLLIPQGSKLIGIYDSQVSFGQSRVLLVWSRLIFPNGRSIVLERQSGADSEGYAGLEDQVDYHWSRLFMAAALSTLLGVGSELGASNTDSDILRALRRGSSDSLNQTGQQIVRRNLNVQPTLTIRPGFPVRVIVNRDLVLAPYPSCGGIPCPS